MANVTWVGGAAAVAQVNTYTFTGTWLVGETVTFAVGQKAYSCAITSTVIATFLPLLAAAYNALDSSAYPEMAEQAASSTSTTLVLTADTAGKPFAATVSTSSASGLINGGASTAGTATTASAGPSDWGTAKNWSGGSVPGADSVYFENSADDVLYGLAQSGVTAALLEIRASFTGTIGLPLTNQDATAYPEYRATALAISATTLNVGDGPGQGSGRLKINVGTNACTLTVFGTDGGKDADVEALQWKGTNAGNVVNVLSGEVGVAGFVTEAATVATLRIGYETSQDSDAKVRCSVGCTLTTITQNGGDLTINSAATTITKYAGTLTTLGSGAITTLTNNSGTVNFHSTGTVTTYTGGPASTLDRGGEPRAVTFTTTTLLPGATLTDGAGSVTFTNGIVLSRGKVSDYTLDVGFNRTLTPS